VVPGSAFFAHQGPASSDVDVTMLLEPPSKNLPLWKAATIVLP